MLVYKDRAMAEETRALWIDEGAENDFVNFVYPRILKSFPILLV